jgi:hypothetical protein
MARNDEFGRANRRALRQRRAHRGVAAARYDAKSSRIVLSLDSGVEVTFSPRDVEGLDRATAAELKTIEVSPSGLGVHFPKLDADLYVPALLGGFLGSRRWMAARMGAAGGKAKSPAKRRAACANGRLGGRPRKLRAG